MWFMILKNINAIEKQTVTMQGAEKVQMQLLCGPDDGCPTFAMRKFIVGPQILTVATPVPIGSGDDGPVAEAFDRTVVALGRTDRLSY